MSRLALRLCLGAAVAAIAVAPALLTSCAAGVKTQHPSGRLKEGDRAPDVGAPDQDGAPVRLSQFRGRLLVLYFYPKDQTSGCTLEAHAFSADYDKFRQAGADVVGVSNDDSKSHKEFCDKDGIRFRCWPTPTRPSPTPSAWARSWAFITASPSSSTATA
jgi:peroxiredoxin Q/BCP